MDISVGGRRSGRTLAMVKALREPCTVVVHTQPMATYLRHMIVDVRGPEVAKATRIVLVNSMQDIDRLRGLGHRIEIDHAWWDQKLPDGLGEAVTMLKAHEERLARA